MRKLPMLLLIFFALFLVFDFVVIPNTIVVERTVVITAKKEALYRLMVKDNQWLKSIDSTRADMNSPEFSYHSKQYKITYKTIASIIIQLKNKDSALTTSLSFIPHEPDSTYLLWQTSLASGTNPITRFKNYLLSRSIGNDFSSILQRLKNYVPNNDDVYGIKVEKMEVNDSILVASSSNVKSFPTISYIYGQFNKLRLYVQNNSGNITGPPMLNISTGDSINYLVRVALPVDKELAGTNEIKYKRMMNKGKILKVRVKGGYDAINKAYTSLVSYVNDYHFVSPAISFQSLITDRSKVANPDEWITDIYYPVM